MKKQMTLGLIFALTIFLCVTAVSGSVEVSNSYQIEGNGSVDRILEIETSHGYIGQKFTEILYTNVFDDSKINMVQDLTIITGYNDSDIEVYGLLSATNARANQYIQNYNIGSLQCFKSDGVTLSEYEYVANNFSSLMFVSGETIGEMKYNIKLKDLDVHRAYFSDEFRMDGNSRYNIESFMENVSYPATGDNDWLGCP